MKRFAKLCFVFVLLTMFARQTLAAQTEIDTVTYCIDPDWMPYEALRNGQHIGISADYLSLISKLSGYKFKLVPTENW